MVETKARPVVVGAWSEFGSEISDAQKRIFDFATEKLVGVKYEVVAVATQVVSGTNYNFFCNARVVYPDAPVYACFMHIYDPTDGDPYITEIRKV